jgi:hypothetical protein
LRRDERLDQVEELPAGADHRLRHRCREQRFEAFGGPFEVTRRERDARLRGAHDRVRARQPGRRRQRRDLRERALASAGQGERPRPRQRARERLPRPARALRQLTRLGAERRRERPVVRVERGVREVQQRLHERARVLLTAQALDRRAEQPCRLAPGADGLRRDAQVHRVER